MGVHMYVCTMYVLPLLRPKFAGLYAEFKNTFI